MTNTNEQSPIGEFFAMLTCQRCRGSKSKGGGRQSVKTSDGSGVTSRGAQSAAISILSPKQRSTVQMANFVDDSLPSVLLDDEREHTPRQRLLEDEDVPRHWRQGIKLPKNKKYSLNDLTKMKEKEIFKLNSNKDFNASGSTVLSNDSEIDNERQEQRTHYTDLLSVTTRKTKNVPYSYNKGKSEKLGF